MARQSSCRLRTGHSHGADYCLHPWADAYSPPKEQHFPLLVLPNPAELFSWTGPGPASCSAGAAAAPPNCPAAPLAPLTAEQVPERRAVLAVCRQQLPRQWNHASWQQARRATAAFHKSKAQAAHRRHAPWRWAFNRTRHGMWLRTGTAHGKGGAVPGS